MVRRLRVACVQGFSGSQRRPRKAGSAEAGASEAGADGSARPKRGRKPKRIVAADGQEVTGPLHTLYGRLRCQMLGI